MATDTRDYDTVTATEVRLMKQRGRVRVVRSGGGGPIGVEPEDMTPEQFLKRREQRLQEVTQRVQSELQGKEQI